MPLPFNKQLDLKLLNMVKENPILYNTKHLKYLDFDSREVVWQKIGDILNRPAAVFAGIQCQIHFGDFQEEKHKPGFIENLSEYLPQEYSTAWGVEKKILREYKKHQGLSQLDAKVTYNKTARDLPTYGVTFFLVKEKQKGKKKLVPRLLGINAESILRLDEVTKEILQVWPLTHVKSYHAGKGETFTLNFGDYSDKEYSVKSRDALRIRDILQGYIDLIRKRMLARYDHMGDENMIISQDQVQAGRGNVMEVVAHGAEKAVQQSYVGPSKLVAFEPGERPQQGTQIVTAQQAIINELAHRQGIAPSTQYGVKESLMGPSCILPAPASGQMSLQEHEAQHGEQESLVGPRCIKPTQPGQKNPVQKALIDELVQQRAVKTSISMRSDMSKDSVKGLNKINASAVQVVSLLTTPTEASIKEAQSIIESMDNSMPALIEGLSKTIEMQESDSRKKKLQEELQELMDLVKKLSSDTTRETVNAPKAVDNAMTIADLSMQMYFSLDPTNRRRSQQIEKSRASFRKSEKKEDRQRRESFVAAATTALHAVETAQGDITHEYKGSPLNPKQTNELEQALVDKIGKLSATVALYLTAHADPKNIDYSASVTSMNTIKEIMPELVEDVQALASSKSPADRKSLLEDVQGLCAATKRVCTLRGSDDHEKIQEASNDYADISSKLIFTLGQGINVDKRNEIIEIARQVGDKASVVLLKTNELSTEVLPKDEAAAGEVDDAGIRVAHAARDLLACAQLTAPAIHEPHCRSALTAAAESLLSSAQHLANTWKPLVETLGKHELGDQLQTRTTDLQKAIEKLKDSFDNIDDYDLTMMEVDGQCDLTPQERERLKFLFTNSLGKINNVFQAIEQELNEPVTTKMTEASIAKAQGQLDSRLAELNAAVAALLRATADRDNVDYVAAQRAVDDISSLLPAVVKDAKGAGADEAGRRALLQNTRALCDASRALCAAAGEPQPEALHSAAAQFADATRKLRFVLPRTHDPAREQEIMSCAGSVCGAATQVLGGVQQLGSRLGGPAGAELDARGARLADAAQALLASAQVAAGSVESPRCREELLAAADVLTREGQQLQAACRARADPADPLLQRILADRGQLQAELDKFRAAVDADRARLASSVAAAEDKLRAADHELDKPATPLRGESVEQVQDRLSERLAALNGAVAALLAATADRDNVDYVAEQRAVDDISSLLPAVVKDAKGAGADEAGRRALLQNTRALCDASRALCAAAGEPQPEALHSAAAQFADATRKLRFVLQCTQDPAREQEIMSCAGSVCGAATQVLGGVQQLGSRLGGPAGAELDARGARLADAAQALLASAQVAAGSVESPRCREELLAAADVLTREGQQLQAACRTRADPADPLLQCILADRGQLQAELDKFRAAVDADRARLASSVVAAEDKLRAADHELDKPMTTKMTDENIEKAKGQLDSRLAELNAAVAALLRATADRDNVDYVAAQRAVDDISSLLPAVAKDAKGAGADEAGRRALLQNTRALCDASRALCAAAGEPQPEALHSAAAQFADATRKLRFVLPRTHDPAREQEIMSCAGSVCGAATQVLGGVQQLGSRLGGLAGAELDARGARLADAAQALLASAQVAAGSVESPRCREELLAAADVLTREGQQLQAACRARADPADPLLQCILADRGQLQTELDKFRAAVDADRARLASSVAAAEDKLRAADHELDKPATPLRGESVEQLQDRLSERLAALNGAVAALLAATADRDNVDHVAAQRAVDDISSLLPAVAKDAKGAGADEAGRRALLQNTRALCDASRALCAAVGEPQPEALHSAAAQFADATRKLRFVLPRTHDPAREQEIMSCAGSVCGAATQVLGGVQQLGSRLGGPAGAELDARGARLADAAQALLASAQVAAGSVESPRCREELLAAADVLTREGQQLQAACRARADPADPLLQRILADRGQLQAELDKFRAAVDADRARLASSVAAAEDKLRAADHELDKPATPLRGESVEQVQDRLSERLAALNGAVAALLAATADRDNVDYVAAQRAVDDISSLLPAVVKDAKGAGADEAGRRALLQNTRALCDASRALCAAAGEPQPEALHSAAAQFADATRKLRFVLPRTHDPAREQEIMSCAGSVCGAATQVLGGVQQLGSRLGGPAGAELDARGARLADAAQALLASAQVAAGSVESPRCREELLAAADVLTREGQQLQAACRARADPADPLLQRILADRGQLQAELNKFRAAVDADRARLASSVAAAEDKLRAADHELDKPMTTKMTDESIEKAKGQLDSRLAELNAAVAALLRATADRDNVDYVAAQRAVDDISSLLPAVAKDAKGAGADEAGRRALLQNTRALCDASRALCAAAGEPQPEALHSAAAQFADATRKLRFVLPHTQDPAREQEIMSCAGSVCGAATQVLGGVQQLGSRLGGPAGAELDARGARLADAAQALLASAQVAAGSVESPRCREELLAAADVLTREGQQLQAACRARADPADPLLQRILADRGQLQAELDKFRAAVDADRARLASSVAAAEDKLRAADHELDKPATPLRGESVEQVQDRLSERLAALNGAVAALLAATADRDNVDYVAAQRAVDDISSLLPAVAKDAKSAGADEVGQRALLQNTRALCDASRALCAAAGEPQPEALHSAAAQFADATRKLRFVLPRTHDPAWEQEIMSCAGSVCGAATQVLGGVQQLGSHLGGPAGAELDARGARLADAAQALLASAQVAAGSVESPRCREELLAAADVLTREGQQLQAACRARADPADPLLQRILADRGQLQAELDKFRAAVDADRARLASSVAAAEDKLRAADHELDKPMTTKITGESIEKAKGQLDSRLAELNAAVAALLRATADRDNVDYVAAQRAVDDISSLLPAVAKDAKGAGADEAGRRALLQNTRALCDASRALCAAAKEPQPEALHSAAAQFADATRKLRFVFPRTQDPAREQEIMSCAGSVCGAATQVLGGVQQLGSRLGGPAGAELDARGVRLADAAQALLASAQVAAGSVESPRCREELLAAADVLTREGQQLQAACRARADPADSLLQRILADRGQLQAELDKFRAAVDADRARLASSVAAAEDKLRAADHELDKPATPLRGESVEQVQDRLSERLAALNGAVAALLAATADRDNVDYVAAQRAVDDISSLLPAVAKDAKGAGADEAGRRALLQNTRALCDASRALCAAAGEPQPEALHSAAAQFADATRKLRFVLPRTHDPAREQEISVRLETFTGIEDQEMSKIVSCAASACSAGTQLVGSAQQLRGTVAGGTKGAGRATGRQVGAKAGQLEASQERVANATQALLTATQLTAGSSESLPCRTALLKAADTLAREGQELEVTCQLVTDPTDSVLQRVQADNSNLQAEVDKLKGICQLPLDKHVNLRGKICPPVPKRISTLDATIAHALPNSEAGVSSKNFLEHLRSEAELDKMRATEKEKQLHQQFVDSVNEACKDIHTAEDSLKKAYSTPYQTPALGAGDVTLKQRSMQEKLAMAGVQVANLVSANYADKIDYEAASKSTNELPNIMTSIAEDAKLLSSVIHGDARKKFLDDMLGLCQASKTLCQVAESSREKLNETAIAFGDHSAKLLHEVSTDIDPALEKEIISRAKAIGDSASRIALESAELASRAGDAGDAADGPAMNICQSGAECVDAAGKLVYTAKLVSPSIHNSVCQDALVSSADNLTKKLKAFSKIWKQADPSQAIIVEKLSVEAENLDKLLENLKKDVKGELGKRRIEKLVIEDTPLRQITTKILEDAKKRAENTEVPVDERREYAGYANRLADAVKDMDLASSRYARMPHDMEKHRALQDAIQNLQIVLLQTRPKRPDEDNSNIVDLREFIKDVASEADKLNEATSGADVPRAKQTLEGIKEHCDQVRSEAFRFINPSQDQPPVNADTLDGLVEIDHFGQNCGNHVVDINKLLDTLPHDKQCSELRKQADVLDDSCSLLRFATKSAVSMAQGVSYDEAICDLEDLEARVLPSLLPPTTTEADAVQRAAGRGAACAGLARAALAARNGRPRALAPALATYATKLTADTAQDRDKSLQHLGQLSSLLKALAAGRGKRVACWQPAHGPELAAITEQILQELDNPSSGSEALKRQDSLVSPSLVNKLLSPDEHIKTNADKKELEHKMQKLSAYLNWMCGGALPEETNPANLPTKLHDIVDSTIQLGSVARNMKPRDDPVQSQRIEEATQEMSYAAYSLLKTSDLVRQEPKHPESRRKLLDACRALSDSINKLNRVTPCKNKVKRECSEALGALESRCAGLRQAAPPAALPFTACVDTLNEHKDVIHKLKSEEKMTREQFMQSLNFISSAVCNSVEYAAHCNYLLSVSETDKGVALEGLADVPHVQKTAGAVHETCVQIIRLDAEQALEEVPTLEKRVQDLVQALEQAQGKVKDKELQAKVTKVKNKVDATAKALCGAVRNRSQDAIAPLAMELLSATDEVRTVMSHPALVPQVGEVTAEMKARCEEIRNNSEELLNKTQALIKEVSTSTKDDADEDDMLTWTSFSHKKNVVDAFDKLFKSIKANGQKAGIFEIDPSEIEEAGEQKSYVKSQEEIANKWLLKHNCKPEVKAAGEEAAKNVIDVARKMSIDLKDSEKEDMTLLVTESEELLSECSKKYNHEKYSLLSERLKEIRKAVEQGVVTWIVEDFLEGEPPLADLEFLVDTEKDKNKRELILERKIAELLAQLARVNKTANFVTHAGLAGPSHHKELNQCQEQTALLAPLLVKAAQDRIASPDDHAIVDNYKALLAKYTESLSKVRELCDKAVDPTEFVQTAGETMQRLREESSDQDDLQKCDYTSKAITGLAERVMSVSLSSAGARRDPELQRALGAARDRLAAARAPPGARRSALPDWRHVTAEIMRTTGEVEAVLVGENIFEKHEEVDQPIFEAARGLHAAVSSWRARDNGVVAGARRLAVLMARLSDHMRDDKKHDLILTSKSIVMESHEVALLARKLAHECTDLRIKNNLLQTCERIPTISGQLKMLTTVKGSSLGQQGSDEDKEAMDMLVGNAQNLMMSIQEVVKAAASASVKIASQRGPKMRWVRKAYY